MQQQQQPLPHKYFNSQPQVPNYLRYNSSYCPSNKVAANREQQECENSMPMQFNNQVDQMNRRTDRCASTVSQQQLNDQQQLMMLFGDYRNAQSDNQNQFETLADIYNDESANIYTEPTVIDHNGTELSANEVSHEIVNGLLSAPPLPPPPPPPIFTAPVMTPVTTTSLTLTEPMRSIVPNNNQIQLNTQDSRIDHAIQNDLADIMTIQSSNNTDLQRTQSRLTITGQDLAITLNNGEITQTVLSNSNDPNQLQTNPQLLYYYYSQRVEFLPLCDLLFNIISLAAYFCNVVFDSVTAYTLYLNGQHVFLMISLIFILASASISQILSYTWYVKNRRFRQNYLQFQAEQQQQQQPQQQQNQRNGQHPNNNLFLNSSPYELQSPLSLALTHILFGGVLWRYFKLFAPVNLATVKREVRDLCVLRMVHAFSEAGPMLLLQMYLVWKNPSPKLITDLNIISIFLLLFSLCWALASFSKNIRQSKIHKLVLTWLGVIFQFFWRIGTIASRIVALTIYATVYGQWLFAVLFLHWFSMVLWILSPAISVNGLPEHGANIATSTDKKPGLGKRICHAALLAWVYIFCFINMEDSNSRQKMAAFYVTMFLENVILSISLFFDNRPVLWYRNFAFFFVLGSFCFGMFFMWLYYRFFHIRHLKHSLGGDVDNGHSSHRSNYQFCQNSQNQSNPESESFCHNLSQQQTNAETKSILNSKISPVARIMNALSNQCFHNVGLYNGNQMASAKHHHHFHNDNIPGVFNCRLNPALKRKKKKPSTVPPPPQSQSIIFHNNHIQDTQINKQINDIKRSPLETITEIIPSQDPSKSQFADLMPTNHRTNQHRRNLVNQVQRPSTNTTLLTRQYRQPSADTFWRKSNLSARSLSISPSVMLKSENTFRLPAKHPFSSTITTPTSPLNFAPTENFTDKLEFDSNKLNEELNNKSNKVIIRPKPIVQYSLNLDASDEMALQQSSVEFTDPHCQKYYYPYYRNSKLDSEPPEVLLVSQSEKGHVFYDSVVPDYSNQFFDYSNSHSNNNNNSKNDEEENEFMRQFQRPPVPGREGGGDDIRTEDNNDNDNANYVEGKRSIVNYGMDRGRLEKILEMKREEQMELDSHKSQYSQTLPNELNKPNKLKSKQNRNLTNVKIKKKQILKKNKARKRRTKLRPNSLHSVGSMDSSRSSSSSPDLAPSLTTSGDDGDIESDINQHEQKTTKSSYTFRRQNESSTALTNVYDQVNNNHDEYDEAFGSGEGNEDINNTGRLNHLLIKGSNTSDSKSMQASQFARQNGSICGLALDQFPADSSNRISYSGQQQQIANYHQRSSLRASQNDRGTLFSLSASQNQSMPKQKFLYHSAKFKRHNTPL